jgi:arabinose-5-phosphate isomerase
MVLEIEVKQSESLVEELLRATKANIDYFFTHVDGEALTAVIDALRQVKGTIFLSGVGKSGIIAQKIAVTMNSAGTRAMYLPTLDALHGDIGIVRTGDTALLLSKSGETDELIRLCPALRNKGASLIAVVSKSGSRLAKACDRIMILPVARELCPFDMVPTTSTTCQLIFGDLVTVALMRGKNFAIDEYVQNHPAGRIGKRLILRVRDLMVTGEAIPQVSPEDMLINVLPEFSGKRCGALLVCDEEGQLLGIFTDGDLRRSLERYGASLLHKTMASLMTKNPRSVPSDMLAYEAMCFMEADQKHPIFVLPVVDEGRLTGLLKMHDIVQSGL